MLRPLLFQSAVAWCVSQEHIFEATVCCVVVRICSVPFWWYCLCVLSEWLASVTIPALFLQLVVLSAVWSYTSFRAYNWWISARFVWKLRGNIIRTALCWIVWHSVHSQQHTYMSSSYGSNRLGLSHWDPYAVRRGDCLKLYYCNMVEWFWCDSSLISTTSWFSSVLWHCWFDHLACKNCPQNDL